jgi:hypothetical protein
MALMNVYESEEEWVRTRYPNACMARTANGAPWAMPCCLDAGHEGECRFIPEGFQFEVTLVDTK